MIFKKINIRFRCSFRNTEINSIQLSNVSIIALHIIGTF